jgi:hypothetical protein
VKGLQKRLRCLLLSELEILATPISNHDGNIKGTNRDWQASLAELQQVDLQQEDLMPGGLVQLLELSSLADYIFSVIQGLPALELLGPNQLFVQLTTWPSMVAVTITGG